VLGRVRITDAITRGQLYRFKMLEGVHPDCHPRRLQAPGEMTFPYVLRSTKGVPAPDEPRSNHEVWSSYDRLVVIEFVGV
jgi:hypothetical protein